MWRSRRSAYQKRGILCDWLGERSCLSLIASNLETGRETGKIREAGSY